MTSKRRAVVGVDLGGTSVLAAVVDEDGKVLGERKRKTRAELGAEGVTERAAAAVTRAIKDASLDKKRILGVGIGVPGPIQAEVGLVKRAVNLGPSWDQYPLGRTLSRRLGLPVTVENDVKVGAVGEYTYGAGRGSRAMLAIFVGTGIGGGIILNGKLYPGSRNSSGEVGHMVIAADGPLCGCGLPGHAEALASRTAIERDIRQAIAAGEETVVAGMLAAKCTSGGKRDLLTAGMIGDAYEAGDAVTVRAVERAQYYLGLLIAACVNLLDPDTVVVGGGVLERFGSAYLVPVRAAAEAHYINRAEADKVRLVPAALGDFSGALGAAVLARQRLG